MADTEDSTDLAMVETKRMSYVYPENVMRIWQVIPHQFPRLAFKTGEIYDVIVGQVQNPSEFWLTLEYRSKHLKDLIYKMRWYYTQYGHNMQITDVLLREDLYCAAKYDKEYRRCKIVGRSSDLDATIKIYDIDRGIVRDVSAKETYFLHKKFCVLPAQAIRGRIAGIYPPLGNQWPQATSSRFTNLVKKRKVVARIHSVDEEQEVIDVMLTFKEININDVLVKEGLAKLRK